MPIPYRGVLDVVAHGNLRMNGQAFVSFVSMSMGQGVVASRLGPYTVSKRTLRTHSAESPHQRAREVHGPPSTGYAHGQRLVRRLNVADIVPIEVSDTV